MLRTARAATAAAEAQQDRENEIARKDPTKRPRYKGFKDAIGVAVVTISADGTVGFDARARLTTIDLKAAEVLEGELKERAAFKGCYGPQEEKQVRSARWLVTYRMEGGKARLLSMDDATETLLRVARAAAAKKEDSVDSGSTHLSRLL